MEGQNKAKQLQILRTLEVDEECYPEAKYLIDNGYVEGVAVLSNMASQPKGTILKANVTKLTEAGQTYLAELEQEAE